MELVDYNLPVKIPKYLAVAKAEPISQGAEAIVFVVPDQNAIAKYRPPKSWRLPELDAQLRKRRTTQEARVLEKLAGFGVAVPKLLKLVLDMGLMHMAFISGKSLKEATWENQSEDGAVSPKVRDFYDQLGTSIARMHSLNIVHGDLTTSNAMVTPEGSLVLIDFGLSSQSASNEDKAVDLYVLERSLHSTHPREASVLMEEIVMPSYINAGRNLHGSNVDQVLGRLELVRKRGRKRTQLG